MLYAAESTSPVWHYWLAVPLAAGSILAVLTIVALYLFKVARTRFPKGQG